jgi:hypothetical protein
MLSDSDMIITPRPGARSQLAHLPSKTRPGPGRQECTAGGTLSLIEARPPQGRADGPARALAVAVLAAIR